MAKQEQERASDEITEIAPNVLRTQLPIDIPGLGHVNCYLLEDDRGVALVDPGLPTKASYAALENRLKRAGYPLKRVHTVIVTHSHHDHFGGAAWVRQHSGADIVTHQAFRMMWDPTDTPDVDIEDLADAALPDDPEREHVRRYPWESTPWGGPGIPDVSLRRKMWFRAARRMPFLRRTPKPTVRLHDAQTISLARRDWVAVHTPGHTDDHLCLFDPEGGLMLSGDHVLPSITPHIGGMGTSHDPLGMFFRSLDKVATYGNQVSTVLPAHGHPFHDLAGRAMEIREHHDGRLEKARLASAEAGHPVTVMEMSTHLFSPRAQGMMADSETFAHLEHLRLNGQMERRKRDGVFEYVLVG
ncbi:MAG TPA: MBL fold metallo-hydrolase [Ilumatobacteraceae bacterium]|nr:MBL fold metallo-hydrolase [Ilumatobacteraceae bacterium]